MRELKKEDQEYKVRSLRVEEKTWKFFVSLKSRDKSWNLFIQELTDIIKYFKKL